MSLHLGSLARSLDYTCPFTVLLKCVAQLTLPFGNCLNNCLIAPLYTQSLHSELYVGGGGLGTTFHNTRKDLLENKGVIEEGRGRDRQIPDQTD